jgi:hypothetical protein
MGFYIQVERDVKVYIEDVNPSGKKTVFLCTAGREIIIFSNINLICCLKRDLDAWEWITEGLANPTDRGRVMTTTGYRTTSATS